MIRKNIIIIIIVLISLTTYSRPIEPICDITLSTTTFNVGCLASIQTVNVTTTFENCTWAHSSDVVWITVTGDGTGNETLSLSIDINKLQITRTGHVTVANGFVTRTITVTQLATPPAAPPAPTVTKSCGYTNLTHAAPPTGIVYYWQTSSSGTSTSNSADTWSRTVDGTVYIRAYSTSTLQWSTPTSIVVTVNKTPTLYSVSGGGSYCSGGSGVTIGLNDSQTGTTYQLKKNGINDGYAITGTGSPISFGTKTAVGTYTVFATNSTTGCTATMTGSATVTINPLPTVYTVTGGGQYCSGGTGVFIGLSNSQTGVYYQLKNDTTNDGSAVPGTGASLNFGSKTNAGIYTVVATSILGCTATMNGTTTVSINPIPVNPVNDGDVTLCGSGIANLSVSDIPVNSTVKWLDQAGTSVNTTAYYSQYLENSQTYTVKSVSEYGCESTGIPVTATINPLPPKPELDITTKNVCIGDEVTFFVTNFRLILENGFEIKWFLGEELIPGPPFIANTSKTFIVKSYNPITGCYSEPVTATVNTYTKPVVTVVGENRVNFGETIQLTASGANQFIWPANNQLGYSETTGSLLSVLPAAEGEYAITVIGKNTDECADTANYSFSVYKPGTTSINFSRTVILQEPVQNDDDFSIYSAKNIQSVEYFDDLGRPVQSTLVGQSPSGKDIVQFSVYDELGRQAKSYLPFTNQGNGELITDPIVEQQNFYNSQNIDGDATNPYSEVVFDNTPFNRVIEASAPGETWSLGNGHTVKSDIGFNNASDNVIWWTVDDLGQCVTHTSTYYPVNKLYVSRTKNTNWIDTDGKLNTSETYTNTDGQTVLTRQFVVQNGQTVEVNTYYVYDFYGRLSFVLSPEAIKEINTNSDMVVTASILDKWVYSYTYDTKHRLIQKKIPGIDAVVYVYDALNRVILTQNGNLREQNKWSYVKYDKLGRSVLTGLYTNTTLFTQSSMQNYVDNLTIPLFETHTATDNYNSVHGYTNNAFPQINTEILQVVYYDDYDFDNNLIRDYSYTIDTEYAENVETSHTKGKLTGSKSKVLDGGDNWIISVPFYNDKGQTIEVYKEYNWENTDGTNAISGSENVYTKYDFTGKIENTKLIHNKVGESDLTLRQEFEYDHTGRLLKTWHQINSNPKVLLSELVYNELGQVKEKNVHSVDNGSSFLQSADYMYNIRGWITKLNNPDNLANDGTGDTKTDLFAMNFLYAEGSDITDLGSTAQYNGNIAAVKWSSQSKTDVSGYGFTYDKLNQLTSANYKVKDYAGWNYNDTIRYNMQVKGYDLNGNILGINRYGKTNTGFAQIDDLNYFYNGNQLVGVHDDIIDNVNIVGDFKDNGAEGTIVIENPESYEYIYDKNGNMTEDLNKGIEVEYNHLNLPKRVVFNDNSSIEYIYAADGTKLRKSEYNSANQFIAKQDYIDGFVYTDQLDFFSTSEGRVVVNETNYKYQYTFTDQLGSARLSFEDANSDGIPEVTQENHYYPFGMTMAGLGKNHDANLYQYNGKELQSQLNWYDFGWRMQDPQLGVWHCLDPMAEQYYSKSPYHFVNNNPINIVDPDGRSYSSEDFLRRHFKYKVQDGPGGGYGYAHEAVPTGDDYSYWAKNHKENGSADFMAWYNRVDEVGNAIREHGMTYSGEFLTFWAGAFGDTPLLDENNDLNLGGALSYSLASLSAGEGGAIVDQRVPDKIDWNGSSEHVLNGIVQWAKYLCQPNYGATKNANGEFFHVQDIFKNLPRPSDGGYSPAGDINIKRYNLNGDIFSIGIPDVSFSNRNRVMDRSVVITQNKLLTIFFTGSKNEKGVYDNVITLRFYGEGFYKIIGQEILGDRWSNYYW